MTQSLRMVGGEQGGRADGPALPVLPPLTDDEERELRSSIDRDGVQYPPLVDRRGNVIDGNNRLRIAAELGVPCEPKILEVDDETADRLRLSLNLARRYTRLPTLDKRLLLAALARKHEAKATAEAKDRMSNGGKVQSDRTDLPRREAVDDIAAAINEEAATYGVSFSTSGSSIRKAQQTEALPEQVKEQIRQGEISASAAIGDSYPKTSKKAPPKPASVRRVPSQEEREESAANRDAISERAYQAMKTAPPGAQNNPMFWRASKVEALIGELSEISPEVAAGQLLDPAFRYFTGYSREWWSRFTEACEKRLAEERPDLKPVRRKPGRAPWAESGLDSR